ncbi:GNAT family protein [Tropicimonas sp. TH_r6]|uniref:GNAT family N-acetyltransferase n=1 Tax=Tropicimonas sp. TH_r6 TaxID=3082085 RepID=UPI0029559E79|nr:GNAT family protein [Tropicimonas sp. TH_r6]MDV7142519.1 GNAT family protein [Tropicimonas sp. TH_r6]
MSSFTIPTVETDRLRLRAPEMRDFDAYADFYASERSAAIGGPSDRPSSFRSFLAIGGHWQIRGFGRWIVADRTADDALGIVGLYHPDDWPEPEIAWTVFAAAEGRGVALEAATAARAYAYETLGWTTVISMVAPENTRSLALAQRIGARHDGDFDHPIFGLMQVWRHLSPGEVPA